VGSLPARPGHSRDTPVTETTWTYSRQTVELPLACKLPRNRHVGDAEPVYQRHCRRLRHYVSAPSPGIDQSERATCILCIAIVPLNDFLSAVPHSQSQY
jgi:hypothetical protein